MRVACPECQATYEVPDALIGAARRRLRCAKCAHDWLADPPPPSAATGQTPDPLPAPAPRREQIAEPVAALEPAAAPQPVAPPRVLPPAMTWADRPSLAPPPRPAPPPRRGAGAATVAVLWLLSLAVLGGAGYACYAWRAKVMAAWPPSQRVFAALGVR